MKRIVLSVVMTLAVVLAAFLGYGALNQAAVPAVVAQAPAAAPAQSDLVAALEATMEGIYQNVSPSVVYIQVTEGQSSQASPRSRQFPFQTPPQQGSGSGFVWDKQGDIVTNNHVVDGATSIMVTFPDGNTYPATVVGTDVNSDLAVIKVQAQASELQPVTLADSTQVKVGQVAIAIGNPFGLSNTMTVGYVSAVGRSFPAASAGNGPSYTIPDIIQTDAPINPGNSGGVLLDRNGQVIGVTNAIESNSGSSSGVGFAIPSEIVNKVVPSLISSGSYSYSWLGISGTTVTPDLAQAMKLNANQHGALIGTVVSGGPADKGGIQGGNTTVTINGQDVQVGGDIVVAVDGQTINSFEDLVAYLVRSTKPGQQVTLTVLRGGSQQQVTVTLGERPATPPAQTQPTPTPQTQ